MKTQLKLLDLAFTALWPLANRGVPGAAEALVAIIRRRMLLLTGKRAEITVIRLPNRRGLS